MKKSETFSIEGQNIGQNNPPYCIAEVGINHNGDIGIAKKMIDEAKLAGVNAVKFQTFKAEEICTDSKQTYTYQSQDQEVTESMLEMFRRYEFPSSVWDEIKAYCQKVGVTFFSTPQNVSDLEVLLKIGVPALKIGSDDFTNLPLIRRYIETDLPLILSCGMSNMAEVHEALDAAKWFDGYPVSLMLCTSQYPTPPEDVNITKLTTLQNAFPGLVVGYSDHTQGFLAASIAVSLGAQIFEKHFTLDKNFAGPDHWFSEDVRGLSEWVKNIHEAHAILGNPLVSPTQNELLNKKEFRRVIVAKNNINEKELFSEDNLMMRRVSEGRGFSPNMHKLLLGRPAWRKFKKFEPIEI